MKKKWAKKEWKKSALFIKECWSGAHSIFESKSEEVSANNFWQMSEIWAKLTKKVSVEHVVIISFATSLTFFALKLLVPSKFKTGSLGLQCKYFSNLIFFKRMRFVAQLFDRFEYFLMSDSKKNSYTLGCWVNFCWLHNMYINRNFGKCQLILNYNYLIG